MDRPAQHKVKLKSVFEITDTFPALFTGGPYDVVLPESLQGGGAAAPTELLEEEEDHSFPNGILLTARRDEVGVVDIETGRLLCSIPGDTEDVAAIRHRPRRRGQASLARAPLEIVIASKSKTIRHIALHRTMVSEEEKKRKRRFGGSTDEAAAEELGAQGSSEEMLLQQQRTKEKPEWHAVPLHSFKVFLILK